MWSATRQLPRSSSRLLAKRLPILARLDCQRDWGRETGFSESGTWGARLDRTGAFRQGPQPGMPKT